MNKCFIFRINDFIPQIFVLIGLKYSLERLRLIIRYVTVICFFYIMRREEDEIQGQA